jgi:hypothetical protein
VAVVASEVISRNQRQRTPPVPDTATDSRSPVPGHRGRSRTGSLRRTSGRFSDRVSDSEQHHVTEHHHPWWRGLPARAKTTRVRGRTTGRMPVTPWVAAAGTATATAAAPGLGAVTGTGHGHRSRAEAMRVTWFSDHRPAVAFGACRASAPARRPAVAWCVHSTRSITATAGRLDGLLARWSTLFREAIPGGAPHGIVPIQTRTLAAQCRVLHARRCANPRAQRGS